MIIESSRIYLEKLDERHLPNVLKWWNDSEVTKSMGFPNGMGVVIDKLKDRFLPQIERKNDLLESRMYIIVDKTLNKPIGELQYGQADFELGSCRLGIKIGEHDARGRGLGKESLKLFINYLIRDLNMSTIDIDVFPENLPAVYAYKKLGFIEQETLSDFWTDETGTTHDLMMLKLEKKDWMFSDIN